MKQIDLPLYKFYLIEGMTQEDLNELALERNNLSEEVYRLNNIIKEVREYIMTNGIHSDYGDKGIDDENKLLEILDKENRL